MWKGVSRYRLAVQSVFFLLVVFLGLRLWEFVRHYESSGALPYVPHPDGVEGFLPIGGLTSLKYWLATGSIHPYHPAALFIFVGAIAVSAVLRKGFCGFICPVGFVSERLYKPYKRRFKKNVKPPKWIDYPLRSLKYLLLVFFLWAIALKMDGPSLQVFLDGDYWKVADVKMLKFFLDISTFAIVVIASLVLLSVPIRNFWCRYLCPYGALLGLVGLASPFAVTRDVGMCTHCKKCTRNCPAYLPVEQKDRVLSPECLSCMTCVSGCPTKALSYSTPKKRFTLSGRTCAVILLAVFLGIIGAAKLTCHWRTGVSDADFQRLVPVAETLEHPQ